MQQKCAISRLRGLFCLGLGSRQKEACCMTFQILELRAQITIDLHFLQRFENFEGRQNNAQKTNYKVK